MGQLYLNRYNCQIPDPRYIGSCSRLWIGVSGNDDLAQAVTWTACLTSSRRHSQDVSPQPREPFGLPLRSTTPETCAQSPAGRQPRQAQDRLEADSLTLFPLGERAWSLRSV